MKRILGLLFIFGFAFLFGAEQIDFVIPVINEAEVKTLTDILQAVSMILYSNADNGALNYEALLKLIFTFGSFLVFTNIVFMASGQMNGLQSYFTYNAVVVGILSIIYSTKANVMITTNTISEPPSCSVQSVVTTDFVVVPYVLGYGIKVMDSIGTNLTYMFETAMYQPEGELGTPAILDGGYGQNLKNVGQLMAYAPFDTASIAMAQDYKGFIDECLIKGLYSSEVNQNAVIMFYKSKNMWKYINNEIIYGTDTAINGQMKSIWLKNHAGVYKTCENLWKEDLNQGIVTSIFDNYLCRMDGKNPEGSLNYLLKDTLAAHSTEYSNVNELAMQAGFLNASRDSARTAGLGIEGVDYAVGKTKAEAVINAVQGSNYMMEMLPYMTIVFKGLIYAVFPFILVLMILPGGGAIFKQYLKSVLWIQMWMPTAAILNYFIYGYTEQKAQMTVQLEGLTYNSGADLLSSSASLAGVAGLLYLSIPAVSWLFLTGSAQMMGNMTSAVGGAMLKNANEDAINKDMKSYAAVQAQQQLTGEHMGVAETESYNARMAGTSMGAAIVANRENGGIQQQAKREQFEISRKLQATDKTMKHTTANEASSADAAKDLEGIKTAVASGKVDSDGNLNIKQVAAAAAIKGSEEKGNIEAYLNKFDTDGDGKLSQGERDTIAKFQEDNKGVSMAEQQGKLDAIGSLDGKAGVSADDLKAVENITEGVENKNLINKQEDIDALKRMGERQLQAKGVDTSKMSDQELMKEGAKVAAKVDASTNAAKAEGVFNKVGGDMNKLEELKAGMAKVGLANDAATINAIGSLGGGNLDKGLKTYENMKTTMEKGDLNKNLEAIKKANDNYTGGYVQLQKDLGGKEALTNSETMKAISNISKNQGISQDEVIKRMAKMKTGGEFADAQGKIEKHGSMENYVNNKIKQVKTQERENISQQVAKDTQQDNMASGDISFIDEKSAEKLEGQQEELKKIEQEKTKFLEGKDKENLTKEEQKELDKFNSQIESKKEDMRQTVSTGVALGKERMLNGIADSSGSALVMVATDKDGKVRTAKIDGEAFKQISDGLGLDNGETIELAKELSMMKDGTMALGAMKNLAMATGMGAMLSKMKKGGNLSKVDADKVSSMEKELRTANKQYKKDLKDLNKSGLKQDSEEYKAKAKEINDKYQATQNKATKTVDDIQKSNQSSIDKNNKRINELNSKDAKTLTKKEKQELGNLKSENDRLSKTNNNIDIEKKVANSRAKSVVRGLGTVKNIAKGTVVGAVVDTTVGQLADAHRQTDSINENNKDSKNEAVVKSLNDNNLNNLNGKTVRLHDDGYVWHEKKEFTVSFNKNDKENGEITLTNGDKSHKMSLDAFKNIMGTKGFENGYGKNLLNEGKGLVKTSANKENRAYEKTDMMIND